jgi:hypothetical protein
MNVAVVPADGEAVDYLAALKVRAVAIRPDRHILGVASTLAELDAVIARVPRPAANSKPARRRIAAINS